MNIAIFGGSFNPAHRAHYEIIRQVRYQVEFEKILIVPAYKNPFKEELPSIPEAVRVAMLEKTFGEFDNVEICNYELKRKKTSYTFATLDHFRKQYPRHQFFLILGEDTFDSFHLWTKADKIVKLCKLLIFSRPAQQAEDHATLQTRFSLDSHWMNVEIPDISATEIRQSSFETIKTRNWLHPDAETVWKHFLAADQSKL